MSTSSKQSNTAPERSLGQRMEALGKANEVRSRRAALKTDLKRGAVSIRDILQEPPEFLSPPRYSTCSWLRPSAGG